MNSEYLPSKKFTMIIVSILIIVAIIFGVSKIITYFKNRGSGAAPVQVMVKDIVEKDGNNNGIPDWEEYLWGLDPNKNGPENKEFILSKKSSLSESGELSSTGDDSTITENEILSRQFFATITSLIQTGELNQESMQSVTDAVGQKIEATPIPNIYSKNMLKTRGDSETANTAYFNEFQKLTTKYQDADIGGELTLVSQGIVNRDPQILATALSIASSYRAFGADLMKIQTPNAVADIHLDLANNYEKTAQSIEGLTKTLTDPIIGMRALINYKKYSDALVSDIGKLSEILQ